MIKPTPRKKLNVTYVEFFSEEIYYIYGLHIHFIYPRMTRSINISIGKIDYIK